MMRINRVLFLASFLVNIFVFHSFSFAQSIDEQIYEVEQALESDISEGTKEQLRAEAMRLYAMKNRMDTYGEVSIEEQIENLSKTLDGFSQIEKRSKYQPELGILNSGDLLDILVSRNFYQRNLWQGYVDNKLTRIYAGGYSEYDREEGMYRITNLGAIHITVFREDMNRVDTRKLLAAGENIGVLEITDDLYPYLTLRYENMSIQSGYPVPDNFDTQNNELLFDLRTLDFADQEAYPVPPSSVSSITEVSRDYRNSENIWIVFVIALVSMPLIMMRIHSKE